jgi:hypothetical protein
VDDDVILCVHCQLPLVGWAGVPAGPVCHPSGIPGERSSMDCYHLVTVYKHPTPCNCGGALSRLP